MQHGCPNAQSGEDALGQRSQSTEAGFATGTSGSEIQLHERHQPVSPASFLLPSSLGNGVCDLSSTQLCPLEPCVPLSAFTYWVPPPRVNQLHPSACLSPKPVQPLAFPLCCSSVPMLETPQPSDFVPLPPLPVLPPLGGFTFVSHISFTYIF